MNRGVITISESGTVSMPTYTVWMTLQEIADMYNVFGCYVRKAVKAIFKDGILKEQGVRRSTLVIAPVTVNFFWAPVPVITTSSISLALASFIVTLTVRCSLTNTSTFSKPI